MGGGGHLSRFVLTRDDLAHVALTLEPRMAGLGLTVQPVAGCVLQIAAPGKSVDVAVTADDTATTLFARVVEAAERMLRVPERLPRVSVVILSHRPKLLPGAIQSVLAQTVDPAEVQILVQHGRRPWRTKLNEAVAASVGEFFVVLCDDDRLAPTYLAECLAVADRELRADVVFTDRRVLPFRSWHPRTWWQWPSVYRELPHLDAGQWYYQMTLNPDGFELGATLPMTCLVRRSTYDAVGGYNPDIPHLDTELWFRFADHGARVHYIPRPLFHYQRHADQWSRVRPSTEAFLEKFHAQPHVFRRFGLDFLRRAVRVERSRIAVAPVPPEDRERYIETFLAPKAG